MNFLDRMLLLLFGAPPKRPESELRAPELVDETEPDEEGFVLFETYQLKDGHAIASDLEENDIPFRVSMDSGIGGVDERFGSGGSNASFSLYIRDEDREIVNQVVQVRFHD